MVGIVRAVVMIFSQYGRSVGAVLLGGLAWQAVAQPPGLDISLRVEVHHVRSSQKASQSSSSNVVVWLTPEGSTSPAQVLPRPHQYKLIQKDKQFSPHLMLVPTGSSVDFPNLDPFFHNVFSLFNGKRFDLGLYEAHTQRAVRFDRDGVSYIFCNIHPEMGAVIISLSTPYYGVSGSDGTVVIRGVAPGFYRLSVWAENVPADRLDALTRSVEISGKNTGLGTLVMESSGDIMSHHENKFGESYKPVAKDPY